MTSLVFSVDGASLYIGTENGKLLLQTLRSVETPKIIAVGEQGCRVEGLAITVCVISLLRVQISFLMRRKRANFQLTATPKRLGLSIPNR